MKKIIFTLLTAFFACSMAVNAQNSSKLSYNQDGSVILSEELKAKLKAKGISEADYMQRIAERKQEKTTANEKQAYSTKTKVEPKTISKPKLKTKQPIKQATTLKKQAIPQVQKDNLVDKAKQLNLDFAKKGLQYKTQVKTIGGKQYIEIVDLPQQNGMTPATKQ